MLTRSSASYFAKHGIIMVSVDTGWITSSVQTFVKPPLTYDDGACRILDPIFSNSHLHGVLLKNYRIVPW